jgi:hypothetical protein
MLDAFKIFDAYAFRARLVPALLASVPTLALLFVMVPWDHLGLPHAIAGSMAAIVLFAFADFARESGLRVEAKLGTRSTPELLHHHNTIIDQVSKNRYRAFLVTKLKIAAPSEQQELEDPATANAFYTSAGNWLREHTRDAKTFKILFDDLVTYGFRRNLLGLKYISMCLNVLTLTACAAILYFRIPYFHAIENIEDKLFVVVITAVLHSIYMIVAVNKTSVRNASQAYGRQLILSTEQLMAAGNARRSTGS